MDANNTPTRITDEDLKRLEELEAKAAPAPWSIDYMYGGIRHLQRNVDLEAFCDPSEIKESEHYPGRYDGTFLGELRNMLPGLLARLKAAEKAKDHDCPSGPHECAFTEWRIAAGKVE